MRRHSEKYAINWDRLEMIFIAESTMFVNDEVNGLIIKSGPKKEQHPNFKHNYTIQYKGKTFAKLFAGHRGKYRYAISNPVYLTVDKRALYEAGLSDKLTVMQESLHLTFYKFKYAELAIDGYNFVSIHEKYNNSTEWHRTQPLKANNRQTKDEITKRVTGFIIGSKMSDKHITIYEKFEKCKTDNEEYIIDYWTKNGLVERPDHKICRIEVRLKKSGLLLMQNNYQLLESTEFMSSLFKQVAGKYIEFKSSTGRRKSLIDWKQFDVMTIEKPIQARASLPHQTMKSVIKKLYMEFDRTSMSFFKESYLKIAQDYNLTEWLIAKELEWNQH